MAKEKLAVLDTCVIIDALTADDAPTLELWQREGAWTVMADLQKTHRLAVPAVVLAELGRGEPGPVFSSILEALPNLMVLAFDADSALAAGPLRFSARPASRSERRFQDFDALIAGTAIAYGADIIVTGNISHFQKLVENTNIELRNHLGQPEKKGSQCKLVPQERSIESEELIKSNG